MDTSGLLRDLQKLIENLNISKRRMKERREKSARAKTQMFKNLLGSGEKKINSSTVFILNFYTVFKL